MSDQHESKAIKLMLNIAGSKTALHKRMHLQPQEYNCQIRKTAPAAFSFPCSNRLDMTTSAKPAHKLIDEGNRREGHISGIEYNGWTITSKKASICNAQDIDR